MRPASTGRVVDQLAAHGVLPVIAVMVGLAWLAAIPLARRVARPRLHVFACLALTVPIVVVTLMRDDWPRFSTHGAGEVFRWWRRGWGHVADNLSTNSDAFLNVVLFVPASAAWALVTGRPGRVLAAMISGSFLIESLQSAFSLGAPDTTDLIANSLGAVIGVGVAVVAAAAWRRSPRSSRATAEPRLSIRGRIGVALGVVAVAVALVLTLQWRADVARDDLLAELRHTYDGTTLHDLDAAFHGEDPSAFEAFRARTSVRPDAMVYADDPPSAQARYPVVYLGLHRCVFVVWANDGVSYRLAEGDICTKSLG